MNLPEPPEFSPPTPGAPPPPPPPPPPSSAPPPPPPPIAATPTGYVPYVPGGALRPTSGLGRTVLILYRVVCASTMLTAIAIFNRKRVVQDIIERGSQVTAADAADDDRARALLVAAAALGLILLVTAAVVTAVWAGRVAKNAVARGALGVNPGMAKAGWFIPVGMWWLGFRELRRSLEGVGGDGTSVQRWQLAFALSSVLGWLTRNVGSDPGSLRELSDTLTTQFLLGLLGFVLYLAAMAMATKAVHELDRTVSQA